MKCPQCGGVLLRPQEADKDPHIYRCRASTCGRAWLILRMERYENDEYSHLSYG